MATTTWSSTCEPRLEAHEWKKPENYNFDNIGASMLVLFETATLEMWLEVMYHSVDAVAEGLQPGSNWRVSRSRAFTPVHHQRCLLRDELHPSA